MLWILGPAFKVSRSFPNLFWGSAAALESGPKNDHVPQTFQARTQLYRKALQVCSVLQTTKSVIYC